jgi:hypothetical protein
LLQTVLVGGVRRGETTIETARARAADTMARLPAGYRRLDAPDRYPVERSAALVAMRDAAIAEHDGMDRD